MVWPIDEYKPDNYMRTFNFIRITIGLILYSSIIGLCIRIVIISIPSILFLACKTFYKIIKNLILSLFFKIIIKFLNNYFFFFLILFLI